MTTKEQQQDTQAERSYCAMSPTGAHRWMLEGASQTMRGECKYCHAERTFRPFEETVGFNNSRGKTRARVPSSLPPAVRASRAGPLARVSLIRR